MKRTLLIAVAVAALLLGGAFVSLIRSGLSAHDEPTRLEVVIARAFRHWAIPAALRDEKNPVPLTPAALAAARAHWADHCASCHGNDGKGKTKMGQNLYPKAPDMTLEATQSLSDGEIFAIIENGIRLTGMPGWGGGTAQSGYDTWTLVHLVRHLPKITPEEIAEMRAMNPRSPAEFAEMQEEKAFLEGEADGETNEPAHQQ